MTTYKSRTSRCETPSCIDRRDTFNTAQQCQRQRRRRRRRRRRRQRRRQRRVTHNDTTPSPRAPRPRPALARSLARNCFGSPCLATLLRQVLHFGCAHARTRALNESNAAKHKPSPTTHRAGLLLLLFGEQVKVDQTVDTVDARQRRQALATQALRSTQFTARQQRARTIQLSGENGARARFDLIRATPHLSNGRL